MTRLPIVGVMGSSEISWDEYAVPLGHWLATLPVHLLTGGGKGVMTSVAQAFTSITPRQGLSIGCLPTERENDLFICRSHYPNPYIEIPIVTPLGINGLPGQPDDAITRNYVNILTSNIVIALPGSIGTKNEVELAVKFSKPVVLFGSETAFGDFVAAVPRLTALADVQGWVLGQLNRVKEDNAIPEHYHLQGD